MPRLIFFGYTRFGIYVICVFFYNENTLFQSEIKKKNNEKALNCVGIARVPEAIEDIC